MSRVSHFLCIAYLNLTEMVNWLKVGTQILGWGPLVRTFSQKTMGRRFGTISISWLPVSSTHHFSSKRCTKDFGFLPWNFRSRSDPRRRKFFLSKSWAQNPILGANLSEPSANLPQRTRVRSWSGNLG